MAWEKEETEAGKVTSLMEGWSSPPDSACLNEPWLEHRHRRRHRHRHRHTQVVSAPEMASKRAVRQVRA
eukprot:1312630-Rhodomonas_salina.1